MASETENWMETLGASFQDVRVCLKDGTWTKERHVMDPETIDTTVEMSLGSRATYAVYFKRGSWTLRGPAGRVREYPTREAAEMVAIHNG